MPSALEEKALASAQQLLDSNAQAFGMLTSLVPAVAEALRTVIAQAWLHGYNECLKDHVSPRSS